MPERWDRVATWIALGVTITAATLVIYPSVTALSQSYTNGDPGGVLQGGALLALVLTVLGASLGLLLARQFTAPLRHPKRRVRTNPASRNPASEHLVVTRHGACGKSRTPNQRAALRSPRASRPTAHMTPHMLRALRPAS